MLEPYWLNLPHLLVITVVRCDQEGDHQPEEGTPPPRATPPPIPRPVPPPISAAAEAVRGEAVAEELEERLAERMAVRMTDPFWALMLVLTVCALCGCVFGGTFSFASAACACACASASASACGPSLSLAHLQVIDTDSRLCPFQELTAECEGLRAERDRALTEASEGMTAIKETVRMRGEVARLEAKLKATEDSSRAR